MIAYDGNSHSIVNILILATIVPVVASLLATTSLFILCMVSRKQDAIIKAAEMFPLCLETISYSEIPIAVVAVIADHLKIDYKDVVAEYANDAEHRPSIVLKSFRKNSVTDNFIKNFPSKFIRNGYVGEDLLN